MLVLARSYFFIYIFYEAMHGVRGRDPGPPSRFAGCKRLDEAGDRSTTPYNGHLISMNIHFNDGSEVFGYLISYHVPKTVVLDISPAFPRAIRNNWRKNWGKYPYYSRFSRILDILINRDSRLKLCRLKMYIPCGLFSAIPRCSSVTYHQYTPSSRLVL